ncbi:MAG: WD40 repeat domain-containing protein, partial [Candidatus Poseidoniales archaeon]|nr:WD40 repeat domain-containing protein [Candidatus Poseidoniales archaeon]
MLLSTVSLLSMASAGDTDGDGIDDAVDDCPLAAGNSTVDRDGCPDRDGDGTSDKNDPWTIQAGGFLKDAEQLTNNNDYYAVFFNHDGSKYLTSDEDGWTRVWETATKTNLKSVQGSGIRDVGWSPDGVFVAVTTSSDQLHAFYASNVTPLFSVSTAGEETYELEYSPDGTMIAVVGARDGQSGNGQVEIFNSMNGSLTHSFEPAGEDQFYSVDWSPDGSRILIGGAEDVWIYNTGDWTVNRSINTNRGTNNGIAWSPDGNSFATCEAYESSGARVRLYDVASGQQSWSYSSSTSCNTVTFSPDSTQVAASFTYYQSDGARVRLFDADTGNIVDTLDAQPSGGCGD